MVIERNVDLPQEVVVDILLRSPVKFLSRCKCVSRNWCSLIESPSFVKQHFESSRERLLVRLRKKHGQDEEGNKSDPVVTEPVVEPDDELILDDHVYFNYFFLENQRYQKMIYDEGSKYALYVDDTFSEYEDPAHLQIPDGASDVFGPLNGVFCVASQFPRGPMALLNPALRQFKPIPILVQQQTLTEGPVSWKSVLGMGLDPLTGDIKLVSILYFKDLDTDITDYNCVVSVYTSDSDSWRALEDVDSIILRYHPQPSLCNTYVNGAYYWLMLCSRTTGASIAAFDMRTDKLRKIQVDGCVDPEYFARGYLTLYRDSLGLLIYDEYGGSSCTDVWVMVNEGCWIKNARVGPLQEFRGMLLYWKDELLFETMAAFLSQCNAYTQELKTFDQVKRFDERSCSQWIFPYKESLVSIKGKAGKCKLWDTSSNFVKNFFGKGTCSWFYSSI